MTFKVSDGSGALSRTDQEVELKLELGTPEAKALAEREVASAPSREMESIYFDTPGQKLRLAGYSLRLRKDGEQWLQTVKGGGSSIMERYEHERATTGGALDYEMLKQTPISAFLAKDEVLSPLFATRILRRSIKRKSGEALIEFSLDEGEVVSAGARQPILELELELKSGRPEALFQGARRLAEQEALTLGFSSKADRGYALAAGVPIQPLKFQASPLSKGASPKAAFQAVARTCLRQLAANALLVRSEHRAGAVHQARVAMRRLRVALTVFKPMLDKNERAVLKAELLWLSQALAEARDLEVFITKSAEPAMALCPNPAAVSALMQALGGAKERAYDRAANALTSGRFRTLLIDTARWIELAEWSKAKNTVALAALDAQDFGEKALHKRRKAMAKRGDTLDWTDAHACHRFRIEAKKLRYAGDIFMSLKALRPKGRGKRLEASLRRLQEAFGELNDIRVGPDVVANALSWGRGADDEAEAALGAGFVLGRRSTEMPGLTKAAKRAARNLMKPGKARRG